MAEAARRRKEPDDARMNDEEILLKVFACCIENVNLTGMTKMMK